MSWWAIFQLLLLYLPRLVGSFILQDVPLSAGKVKVSKCKNNGVWRGCPNTFFNKDLILTSNVWSSDIERNKRAFFVTLPIILFGIALRVASTPHDGVDRGLTGQVIDQQHSLEIQKFAVDPRPSKRIPQLSFGIAQSSLFNTILFPYESDVQWCLDPGHKFCRIKLVLSFQWFCYNKKCLELFEVKFTSFFSTL